MLRYFVPVLGLLLWSAVALGQSGTHRAQVIDATTATPIDGATVQLDRLPADNTPEYQTNASSIGLYQLSQLTPGQYRLTVTHPLYQPQTQTVEITADKATATIHRMAPQGNPGQVRFSIDVGVFGVRTGLPLPGALVTVEYWLTNNTGTTPALTTLTSDKSGNVNFTNMSPGHYRITIVRPGWQSYSYPSETGSVQLIKAQSAYARLKPDPNINLALLVNGLDPRGKTPADGPLRGVTVELTGMDWEKQKTSFATRSTTTNDGGAAAFKNLMAIPWRVKLKKLGYKTVTLLIDPLNGLLQQPNPVMMLLNPTALKVELDSPYTDPEILEGATIRIRGLKGSHTEGIEREMTAKEDTANKVTMGALFEDLLPGRYFVHVTHKKDVSGLDPLAGGNIKFGTTVFSVKFSATQSYAEVADGATQTQTIFLKPVPAVIRGRLRAVDKLADPWDNTTRVFTPKTATGITFIDQRGSDLLKPEYSEYKVDTEADGSFTISVYPGRFGIQILSLTNYSGHQIVFGERGAERKTLGWPYPDPWPHIFYNVGIHHSFIHFDSEKDYNLELVVHRHFVNFSNDVYNADSDPMSRVILWQDPANSVLLWVFGGDLTHYKTALKVVKDDGSETITQLYRSQSAGFTQAKYRLENLTSGTYTLTGQHPRFVFKNWADQSKSDVVLKIAKWEAPGVIPSVAPQLNNNYYLPGMHHVPDGLGSLFTVEPKSQQKQTIVSCVWHTTDKVYNQIATGAGSNRVLIVDDYPGIPFQNLNDLVPPMDYTLYVQTKDGWAKFSSKSPGPSTCNGGAPVPHTYTIFYGGGPGDNALPANSPIPDTYSLDLKTVTNSGLEVKGLTVTFSGGGSAVSGKVTPVKFYPNTATQVQIDHLQWAPAVNLPTRVIKQVIPPLIKVTVFIERKMKVEGTVTLEGLAPGRELEVELRDRFGGFLASTGTDSDGKYQFGQLDPQRVYVEVSTPGYLPMRKRFVQNGDPKDNPDIVGANLSLNRVDIPQVADYRFDRFGLFLPGVLKSGDAGGFDPDNAKTALTTTWTVEMQPVDVNYTLDSYEDELGNYTPDVQLTEKDKIAEVWLVDERFFRTSSINADATEKGTVVFPETPDLQSVRKFLSEITSGEKDGKPYYVMHVKGSSSDSITFSGTFELWKLPIGDFTPKVIAISKRGGVRIYDFNQPPALKKLTGVALPKWAGFLMNIIGSVATYAPNVSFNEKFPEAKFIPLPNFESGIDLLNGYLSYDYRLGVKWREGVTTPRTGFMGLGPGDLGTSMGAKVIFKVDGKSSDVTLGLEGQLTTTYGKEEGLNRPGILKLVPSAIRFEQASFTGSAKLSQTLKITDGFPTMTLNKTFEAMVGGRMAVDAALFLNLVPVVGPPLARMTQALRGKGVGVDFVIDTAVGGNLTVDVKTVYPKPYSGSEDSVALGHILGGLGEKISFGANFLWNFSVGIRVKMFKGRVEGSGYIKVGKPSNVSAPGVEIEVNTESLFPPIKRVRGAVTIGLQVSIKAWLLNVSKSWSWDLIRIDWQLASEALFDMIPSNETTTVLTPATAPPSVWVNKDGLLIEKFFGSGSLHAASLGLPGSFGPFGAGLIYTQTSSDGSMKLMVSLPGSADWSKPVEIASVPGALGLALAQLPDGRYLAIWSEVPADQRESYFPNTTLNYSISDADGANWSAPEKIVELEGVAHELKIVRAGDQLILSWWLSNEGPLSNNISLHSAAFVSNKWGNSREIHAVAPVRDYDLAGDSRTDGEATVVVLRENGQVDSYSWDGQNWSSATSITDKGNHGLGLAVDADGVPWVALGLTGGTIKLFKQEPNSVWTDLGTLASDVQPREIRLLLLANDSGRFGLLNWIDTREDSDALWTMQLTPAGGVLDPPKKLIEPGSAALNRLRVVEGSDNNVLTIRSLVESRENNETSVIEVVQTFGALSLTELQPDSPNSSDLSQDDISAPNDQNSPDSDVQTPADSQADSGSLSQSGGGGCSTHSSSPAVPTLLLLVLLMVVVRRRVLAN